MSGTVDSAVAERRVSKKEIIIDFVPAELAAPFLLRCGALIVDYILLVSVPVIGLLLSKTLGTGTGNGSGGIAGNTSWLIAILIGLTNFFIFPALTGQSVGKMLAGIRILKMDGQSASFGAILVRHTFGYLFTLGTLGFGFILAAINKNGRALHDFLAGTIVVRAQRRIK